MEITIAAAIVDMESGQIMGANVADVTFGYEMPMPAPPRPLSAEEIGQTIAKSLTPVVRIVNGSMRGTGLLPLGQIMVPMSAVYRPEGAKPIGTIVADDDTTGPFRRLD